MDKLLIIDDDKSLLELLGKCMKGLYEVDTARNGRQGMDRLAASKYDLVLLDVMLPGEDPHIYVLFCRMVTFHGYVGFCGADGLTIAKQPYKNAGA